MKKANQILSVFLGIILIVSSTGILIYKTHCVCTGNNEVSLYVKPDSCVEDFHVHHTHNHDGCEVQTSGYGCHECSTSAGDCGCESPEVEFIKLINQISEDEFSFLKTQHLKISVITASIFILFEEVNETEQIDFYTDPPPLKSNSKRFLIEVNQLKIPYLA